MTTMPIRASIVTNRGDLIREGVRAYGNVWGRRGEPLSYAFMLSCGGTVEDLPAVLRVRRSRRDGSRQTVAKDRYPPPHTIARTGERSVLIDRGAPPPSPKHPAKVLFVSRLPS
jgi:hypothetical protein